MAIIPEKDRGGIPYEMIDLHNGKGYVGKDSNPKFVDGAWIAQRPAVHISSAKRGSVDCRLLHRAIRRNIRLYGKPYFYVIHHQDYQLTNALLNTAEEDLIAVREYFTDRSKGYNLTEGGEGTPGYVPSQEQRDNMSAASKGKPKSPEHAEAVRTACAKPDVKARQRAATKEAQNRPEVKAKKSAKLRGRPKSPEHIAASVAAKKAARIARYAEKLAQTKPIF